MLEEEYSDSVSSAFLQDLKKIQHSGRRLLGLVNELFDGAKFGVVPLDLTQVQHELRTPLNHIIGYSELLGEEAETTGKPDLAADLNKVHEAAKELLRLAERYLFGGAVKTRAAIQEMAGPAPAPSEQAVEDFGTTKSAFEGSRLLVVDDNAQNREMLTRRLQRQGYEVLTAEHGIQALELIRRAPLDLVLLDLVMPGMDGYQVLAELKGDKAIRHIPVIMLSALDEIGPLARCILMGAEDYLLKPFNPILLKARIGACLEKKALRDHEQQMYQALLQSQRQLAAELSEAADYVRSLLPGPLDGPVRVRWCFQPSTQLGGDAFGYHWLDAERLAIYLLDVCGHGVGAALLSASVMNVLRTQALPATDFSEPAAVLQALNHTFRMENQNNMYFTIWYGVFDAARRRIIYASAGHPPAVLFQASDDGERVKQEQLLRTQGMIIGYSEEAEYRSESCDIGEGASLYVMSDGVYEIAGRGDEMMEFEQLVRELKRVSSRPDGAIEDVLKFVQNWHGSPSLEDDFSLVQLSFSGSDERPD